MPILISFLAGSTFSSMCVPTLMEIWGRYYREGVKIGGQETQEMDIRQTRDGLKRWTQEMDTSLI